jgi:hypothetical protein
LANLVCLRLDARIAGYVGKRGIVYTRYADDLTFSAFETAWLKKSLWVIRQIIDSEGFQLNSAKTRFAGPSRCRRVTGLVLSEGHVGIGRHRARELRKRLYRFCSISGDAADDDGTLQSLQGYLAFVKGVDPERSSRLREYIIGLQAKYSDMAITKIITAKL